MESSFGKMPTTSARRLTSLFSRSSGFVECSLVRCCAGEGHVGEHVMLGLVHEPAEFLEPGPQLIGDMPPDLARRLAVGLDEGLADARRRQPSPASLARRPAHCA